MRLSDYFKTQGKQAELSRSLSIPASLLSDWASGKRPVPVTRCVPIEAATGGEVTRKDLRPDDWHLIWPELTARRTRRVTQ